MLSNTSNFAIRALVYLELYSSPAKKVGIKQMITDLDIPAQFLSKILQLLVKSKLLGSSKGPNGGFYLTKPAIDITMLDVVEAIDGKENLGNCVIKSTTCEATVPCSVHHKVSLIRAQVKIMLRTESIADLVSEFREREGRIRI
jgi:Rrf2 family protein